MGSTSSLLERLGPGDGVGGGGPLGRHHFHPPMFSQGVSRIFAARTFLTLAEFQLLLTSSVPGFPTPLILALYRTFCSSSHTSGIKAPGLMKLLGALQGSPVEVAELLYTLYLTPHHRPSPTGQNPESTLLDCATYLSYDDPSFHGELGAAKLQEAVWETSSPPNLSRSSKQRWIAHVASLLSQPSPPTSILLSWPASVVKALTQASLEATLGPLSSAFGPPPLSPPSSLSSPLLTPRASRAFLKALRTMRLGSPTRTLDARVLHLAMPTLSLPLCTLLLGGEEGRVLTLAQDVVFIHDLAPILTSCTTTQGEGGVGVLKAALSLVPQPLLPRTLASLRAASRLWRACEGGGVGGGDAGGLERHLLGLPSSTPYFFPEEGGGVSDGELRCASALIQLALYVDLGIPPPTKGEEYLTLTAVNTRFPGTNPCVGDTFFLVPMPWFQRWLGWCREEGESSLASTTTSSSSAPGPIPTHTLCPMSGGEGGGGCSSFPDVLPGLKFGVDYEVVCPRAWRALSSWHGVEGPPLPRALVDTSVPPRASQLQQFCNAGSPPTATTTTTPPFAGSAPSSLPHPPPQLKRLSLEVYLLRVQLLKLVIPTKTSTPVFLPADPYFPLPTLLSLAFPHHTMSPTFLWAWSAMEKQQQPQQGMALSPKGTKRPTTTSYLLLSRNTPATTLHEVVSRVVLGPPPTAPGIPARTLRLWRAVQASEVEMEGGGESSSSSTECLARFLQWPFLPLCFPTPLSAGSSPPSSSSPPQFVWQWPSATITSSGTTGSTFPLPTPSPFPGFPVMRILFETRGAVRGHWAGEATHSSHVPLAQAQHRAALRHNDPPPNCALYLPVGLHNPSNSCYLNSPLQALFSLPFLPQYFSKGLYLSDLRVGATTATHTATIPSLNSPTSLPLALHTTATTREAKLTAAFASLCRVMWTSGGASGWVNPWRVRRLLTLGDESGVCGGVDGSSGSGSGSGGGVDEQEDAEEAVSKLLSSLHTAVLRPRAPHLKEEEGGEGERSFLSELFQGQYETKVACTACSFTSTTHSPFWLHSVQLPEAKGGLHVTVYLAPNPLCSTLGGAGRGRGEEEVGGDLSVVGYRALPLFLPSDATVLDLKREAVRFLNSSSSPPILPPPPTLPPPLPPTSEHALRPYSPPSCESTGDFPLTPDTLLLLSSKGTLVINGGGGSSMAQDSSLLVDFYPMICPPRAPSSLHLVNPSSYHLILFPVPPLSSYKGVGGTSAGGAGGSVGDAPPPPLLITLGSPVFATWSGGSKPFPAWVTATQGGVASVEFEDGDKATDLPLDSLLPRTPLPATLHCYHTTVALVGQGRLPGAPPPSALQASLLATSSSVGATLYPFIPHPHLTPTGLSDPTFFLSPLIRTPLPVPPIITRISPSFTSLLHLYLLVHHSSRRFIKSWPAAFSPLPRPPTHATTLSQQAAALPPSMSFPVGARGEDIKRVWGFTLKLGTRAGLWAGSECPVCPWYLRCSGCVLPPNNSIPLSRVRGLAPPGALLEEATALEGGAQVDATVWSNVCVEWDIDMVEGGGWDSMEASGALLQGGGGDLGASGDMQTTSVEACLQLFSDKTPLPDFKCPTCAALALSSPSSSSFQTSSSSLTTTPTSGASGGAVAHTHPTPPTGMGHCFQTLSLRVLPPVLVIQLKRFSYVGNTRAKLFTPVRIPVVMQLEGVTFILYSYSNHYGSLQGGHYETTLRVGEEWRVCNDDLCTVCDPPNSTPSTSAYLLFYVREELHKEWVAVCSASSSSSSALEEALARKWPRQTPQSSPRTIHKVVTEADTLGATTTNNGKGRGGGGGKGESSLDSLSSLFTSTFHMLHEYVPTVGSPAICSLQ